MPPFESLLRKSAGKPTRIEDDMTQAIPAEAPFLVLNEDQVAVAQRHIKDAHFALATITQCLEGKMPLTEELVKNCLSVSEYQLRDLCKTLGVETHGAAEIDERHAKLRAANMRIRELEGQLGDSNAPELTQMGVKRLSEHLNKWWDLEGFGHIAELKFGPYGVDVKFSCNLFGDFHLIGSKTPVSDRERKALWYASLAERGFVLCVEEGEREPAVDDCDQSRRTLADLFTSRMPSAFVTSFHGHGRRGQYVLRDVEVFIRNYADILALPVPEPKEDE